MATSLRRRAGRLLPWERKARAVRGMAFPENPRSSPTQPLCHRVSQREVRKAPLEVNGFRVRGFHVLPLPLFLTVTY